MFHMTKFPSTRMTWSERIKPTHKEADYGNAKKENPEGIQIIGCHPWSRSNTDIPVVGLFHSFNKYSVSTYYMSSALPGTGDAIVIKTDNGLGPGGAGEPLNPQAPCNDHTFLPILV